MLRISTIYSLEKEISYFMGIWSEIGRIWKEKKQQTSIFCWLVEGVLIIFCPEKKQWGAYRAETNTVIAVEQNISSYGESTRESPKFSVNYSQPCIKRPYTTRHIFGFSDRWLLIAE